MSAGTRIYFPSVFLAARSPLGLLSPLILPTMVERQCGCSGGALLLNAFLRFIEVFRVILEANEVTPFVHCGNGRSSRAHEWI